MVHISILDKMCVCVCVWKSVQLYKFSMETISDNEMSFSFGEFALSLDSFCELTLSADVMLFCRFPVLSYFYGLKHVIFKKLFHLLPLIRSDQTMSQKMHKDLNFANP